MLVKSVVIRSLYQTLYRIWNLKDGENPDEKRILLCAYMGFAVFNISGQTMCSAFHKKMYQGTNHLSADVLNKVNHFSSAPLIKCYIVGMIVVHTANVDVEDGLTNGANGVVKR